MEQYYKGRIALLNIQEQALTIGSEILVSNLVDQAGHIDFEKLSNILQAYDVAKNNIKNEREFAEENLKRIEKINGKEYNEKGGEKNDSESL